MTHATAHTHHRRLCASFATLDAISNAEDTPMVAVARELLDRDPATLDAEWVMQCDDAVRWCIGNIKRHAAHMIARYARRRARGDTRLP